MKLRTYVAGIADVTGPAADVEMMVNVSDLPPLPNLRVAPVAFGDLCLRLFLDTHNPAAKCRATRCRIRSLRAYTHACGRAPSSLLKRQTPGTHPEHMSNGTAQAIRSLHARLRPETQHKNIPFATTLAYPMLCS